MNNCYVGVDIGGTSIKVSLFDDNTLKIYNYKYPFIHKKTAKQEIDTNICEHIDKITFRNPNINIMGIGLSLAALFDRKKGTVINWPNNALWNGYDIEKHLKRRYGKRLYIEDDANCAAFGEFLFQPSSKNLLYITISTGVGCGIIIDKKIYAGEGFAGELGHIKVKNNGELCTCGQYGCLQSIVSGPALLKKYNNSLLEKGIPIIDSFKEIQVNLDETATVLFNNTALLLSNIISNLVMILDIRQIILGGGVILNHNFIFNTIKSNLNFMERNINIEKAKLGEYSGSIGIIGLMHNNPAKIEEYMIKDV